jgi:tetratricopeptide (TPR) repeat protein
MGMEVLRTILFSLLGLCLIALSFAVGGFVAKKTKVEPVVRTVSQVPAENRAAAASLVEAALASRFAGRPSEALSLLMEARREDPTMRGLDYQIGLTHLALGEFDEAEAAAAGSLARGEEVSNVQTLSAAVLMARAVAAGSVEASRSAVLDRLAAARAADPLSPAPQYVMGEFHRALGEPEAAVEAYRKALQRVAQSDGVIISTVKAGLSGLRLNQKTSGPPLSTPSVAGVSPPEQLFFAAADALLRGDQQAALVFLREAQGRVSDPVYKALLQDSFFQDYLPSRSLELQSTPPQG